MARRSTFAAVMDQMEDTARIDRRLAEERVIERRVRTGDGCGAAAVIELAWEREQALRMYELGVV